MSQLKTLIRALVRTFYEDNVGFFLVVLYLAFGLMRSTEHIALASAIATSWTLTLLTLALWAVYGFKTMGFVYNILRYRPYRVLRELALYPLSQQWKGLFAVHFLLLIPAWAYGTFIARFNLQYGSYEQLVAMLLFLFAVTFTSTWATIWLLKRPVQESRTGLWHRWIGKRFALPQSFWYIRHLFVHEPLAAFLAKVGSLLVLTGAFYLYGTDTYDWRLLAVGSLFAFTFNTMLVFGLFRFTQENAWTFNLPRFKRQITSSALGTLAVLFIPELLLIAYNAFAATSVLTLLNLCLLVVALAFFWLGMLIRFPIAREDYGKRTFYLTLVLVLVLMYSIPLLLTNTILLSIGGWGLFGVYRLKWSE